MFVFVLIVATIIRHHRSQTALAIGKSENKRLIYNNYSLAQLRA